MCDGCFSVEVLADELLGIAESQKKEAEVLKNGKCPVCEGKLIKRVSGIFGGKLEYSLPECSECGRVYVCNIATIPTIGEKEFMEKGKNR